MTWLSVSSGRGTHGHHKETRLCIINEEASNLIPAMIYTYSIVRKKFNHTKHWQEDTDFYILLVEVYIGMTILENYFAIFL